MRCSSWRSAPPASLQSPPSSRTSPHAVAAQSAATAGAAPRGLEGERKEVLEEEREREEGQRGHFAWLKKRKTWRNDENGKTTTVFSI